MDQGGGDRNGEAQEEEDKGIWEIQLKLRPFEGRMKASYRSLHIYEYYLNEYIKY